MTPQFEINKKYKWFDLRPHLDVQANKDSAKKTSLVYTLGLQGQISLSEKFYVAPEVCIAVTSINNSDVSFPTTGLFAGYRLENKEWLGIKADRISVGYRRFYSEVEANQAILVLGFGF